LYYGYSKKATSYIAAVAMVLTAITVILAISGTNPKIHDTIAPEGKGVTVVLDAGHGGEDPGAIGVNGSYEKDLNLAITLNVAEQLRNLGMNVVLTREDDKLLYKPEENIKGLKKISDLKNRVAIANTYENAILISIHMNSYGNESCFGLQTYYGKKDGSNALANSIQASVKTSLQPANKRSVKYGEGLYLLENSAHPAVIVECGFITNKDECAKLSQKEYQKELSFSIVCGIIDYVNKIQAGDG
jgi:N-acetylmuramoyl-L-alanine amidase